MFQSLHMLISTHISVCLLSMHAIFLNLTDLLWKPQNTIFCLSLAFDSNINSLNETQIILEIQFFVKSYVLSFLDDPTWTFFSINSD